MFKGERQTSDFFLFIYFYKHDKKKDSRLRKLASHDGVSLRVNNLSAEHEGEEKEKPGDSNEKEKRKRKKSRKSRRCGRNKGNRVAQKQPHGENYCFCHSLQRKKKKCGWINNTGIHPKQLDRVSLRPGLEIRGLEVSS